jgi:excisionase family DNA binding protein
VSKDYLTVEEAAQRSGLHVNSIKRLVRAGVVEGHKATVNGRHRWLVSARSLRRYTDPYNGFLLDMPGPKLFLRKLNEDDEL